ncbi:MAG: hypothetical protein LBH01_00650 [Verrucomicrobiales bacterium]|jgi:hypothetical protein|nr:hypothetical protein [Verrucomicrobiales bacterium]
MKRALHLFSALLAGTFLAALGLAGLDSFHPEYAGFFYRWYCFAWGYCLPASLTGGTVLLILWALNNREKR